ncbi:MAG: aminodeoxychorismate synthase component I, partial [Rhodospirillales bacterium]|nr:aminodeoxychorismate synthase component I [Rhodospirillales bacterium]
MRARIEDAVVVPAAPGAAIVVPPVGREISYRDPLCAAAAFADDPMVVFFDSAAPAGGRGRYSYIAADPYRVITAGERVALDGVECAGDPFTVLERELAGRAAITAPELPPFQGGAAGFLGYELARHLERLPEPPPCGLDLADMVMGLFDTVIAFDNDAGRAWIVAADGASATCPDRPPPEVRIQATIARLDRAPPVLPDLDWRISGAWRPEVPRQRYEEMVRRAVEFIHAGDIFQANVTQRIIGRRPADLEPFTLYRRLRSLSPAPFAAFVNTGRTSILSASPERFLRLGAEGDVDTRPIKGTRPRGRNRRQDRELAEALLASEKDRAENLMIVDLLRNDLSRVCRIGSVTVRELCALESFANVHHLVSEVQGRMAIGKGAVDLLRAAFPGGSVTGAPKIRAIEIINELEPSRRGPYCGAIACIGFDGAMEANIVIRTMVVKGDQVVAQAGGGIVADSVPADEYAESMDKAGALLQSLDPGFEG